MYNIYWKVDPTNNPYVELTFNGTPYAGNWDDLCSEVGSPFKTLLSESPQDKPTCTAQGSDSTSVDMTVGSDIETSLEYGGSRPPTW